MVDSASPGLVGVVDVFAITQEDTHSLALVTKLRGDTEILVECAAAGGEPRQAPPHPFPVRQQLFQRSARDDGEGCVALVQQVDGANLAGRAGTAGAAGVPVGMEHEMLDNELPPPLEQVEK